jgi:hypothetical protein
MVCRWQPRVNRKELVKFSASQNDNHGWPMVTVMQLVSLYSAADLTRGGGPYAWSRIRLASRLPRLPNEGRREGSLVKSG